MSDLYKMFGVSSDDGQPNSECVLKKQNWELGVVNGTLPVLRVSLIGQTQYDFHQLVNALKDNELPFDQRVRTNGDMVMEVRGADNFMKLANMLGQERISQIQHNTDLEHVKSIDWQQGQQDGVMMTIYADGKYDPNVKTVADTLERLGINSRPHSYDSSKLIVCGENMTKLNDIIGLKGPVQEWAEAFRPKIGRDSSTFEV